jgi:hypothetical protein
MNEDDVNKVMIDRGPLRLVEWLCKQGQTGLVIGPWRYRQFMNQIC